MLNLIFEKSLWDKGIELIAGVDEVGRGALAGPMVVCAVILKTKELKELYEIYKETLDQPNFTQQFTYTNNDVSPLTFNDIPKALKTLKNQLKNTFKKGSENNKVLNYINIKDSKELTPKKRLEISEFVKNSCVEYSIYQVSNKEIDKLGISKCTQIAFYKVVQNLKTKPEHILTDSFPINNYPANIQTNIKHGDKKSITISAASILAKVYRDDLITKIGENSKYAPYNFKKHKGYGTKEHLQKIKEYGLSDLHRQSFIHLNTL